MSDVTRTPLFVRRDTGSNGNGNGGDRPQDLSRWRQTTVRTRIVVVAGLAVLLVAAIVVTAVIGISRVLDASGDVTRAAEARRRIEVSTRALDRVLDAVSRQPVATAAELDAAIADLDRANAALEPVAGAADLSAILMLLQAADEGAVRAAVAAREAAVAAGGQVPATDLEAAESANRRALDAHTTFDAAFAEDQDSAREQASSARRQTLVWLVILAVLGAIVTIGGAVALGRGVVRSTRALGQGMRRFGDGDLHVRAPEAPDEIGVLARSFNQLADGTAERIRAMASDSERVTQLRIVSEALEIAPDEADVHRIMEHALGMFVPGTEAELLMSPPGSTQLHQVVTNPNGGAANCPVADVGDCLAVRWGRAVTFERPEALNACPLLRGRPSGPRSAACVPMASGGAVIGVLHATADPGEPPSATTVEQLVSLASRAGTRVASIRTLERSRQQARTDTLTGLANRRTLEAAMGDLIRTSTPFVVVMADLDHFKSLNDTFGHETGDRALQLFAEVLSDNVRGHDIVARIGGEEFVLVYPETNLERAMEVIDRIRGALGQAIASSDLPPFTCSFGVAASTVGDDVDTIVRIADAGLLVAKEQGRDRVITADAALAARVFGERAPSPAVDLRSPRRQGDPVDPPLIVAERPTEPPVERRARPMPPASTPSPATTPTPATSPSTPLPPASGPVTLPPPPVPQDDEGGAPGPSSS